MKIIFKFFFLILMFQLSYLPAKAPAQVGSQKTNRPEVDVLSAHSLIKFDTESNFKETIKSQKDLFSFPEMNTRRITGLAYSTFVPGSGQFYLGHKLKGSLITVGFFGSLITTIVSHNNFIGNKERLDNLKFDYYNADKYSLAEELWLQIKEVHEEQKMNEKNRNIFIYVTIGLWALNIFDYLFLTDDLGVTDFALNQNHPDQPLYSYFVAGKSGLFSPFSKIDLFSVKIPL